MEGWNQGAFHAVAAANHSHTHAVIRSHDPGVALRGRETAVAANAAIFKKSLRL